MFLWKFNAYKLSPYRSSYCQFNTLPCFLADEAFGSLLFKMQLLSVSHYLCLLLTTSPWIALGSPVERGVQNASRIDALSSSALLHARMPPKKGKDPEAVPAATEVTKAQFPTLWAALQNIEKGSPDSPSDTIYTIIETDNTPVPLILLDCKNGYGTGKFRKPYQEVCKNFCFSRYGCMVSSCVHQILSSNHI